MLPLSVKAQNKDGTEYVFSQGDVLRFKVFDQANVEKVYLIKNVEIEEETASVEITLSSEDTKIGQPMNKPITYWYEIELNPETQYTNTIVGYTKEKGAAIFLILPEGGDKQG